MRVTLPLITACFACLAGLASAHDLPRLHDVQGVASDDVLNVRSDPGAGSEIVGELAPDARGVEVIARNDAGTWGQVNIQERSGWVSLRYMEPRDHEFDAHNLPVGLSCYGTEPFWSLTNMDGSMRYEAPIEDAQDMPIETTQTVQGRNDLRRMVRMRGPDGTASGFLYQAACNDGMSDRNFALSISLMMGPDGPLFSGCCTLSR